MAAFDEETFGPLAAVITANDEAHAIELANNSRFGLGASVWTTDRDRGEQIARREYRRRRIPAPARIAGIVQQQVQGVNY
jgi:acyl-CoA reductase-like NAD-dependent aldehyde dehydrogenase